MPPTASGSSPDASTASRTACVAARQMSSDDCSTISPGSRQIMIGRRALAMSRPAESNTPALALSVPTSTPIVASVMIGPAAPSEDLPISRRFARLVRFGKKREWMTTLRFERRLIPPGKTGFAVARRAKAQLSG